MNTMPRSDWKGLALCCACSLGVTTGAALLLWAAKTFLL